MDSDEHTEVSLTKTVHIRKRWKSAQLMRLSGSFSAGEYVLPKLLLENDPTKMLQLCCYRTQGQNRIVFHFTLSVTIEGFWMCRGKCKVLEGSEVLHAGSVVTASGSKESVKVFVLETETVYNFVEINFKFFLDEEECKPTVEKNFVPTSCDDMCKKLLTSEGGPCSFVLKVGGKTIVVHGCVLAMHSEVFKRMIEQDGFREGRQRVVEITDADYDSVMAMVRFMHGFSDAARDHPEGVLALADKYAVEPLKEFAVVTLKERIDRSTVAHIAAVATLHAVPTLFKECKEYVAANLRVLSATAEWKNLRDTNAELLLKLVCDNNDD